MNYTLIHRKSTKFLSCCTNLGKGGLGLNFLWSGSIWRKLLNDCYVPSTLPHFWTECLLMFTCSCLTTGNWIIRGTDNLSFWLPGLQIRNFCTSSLCGLDIDHELLDFEPDTIVGWDCGEQVEYILLVGGMWIVTGERTSVDCFQRWPEQSPWPPCPSEMRFCCSSHGEVESTSPPP